MSKKNVLNGIILHHLQRNGVNVAIDTNVVYAHIVADRKMQSNITIFLLLITACVAFFGFVRIPVFYFEGRVVTNQMIYYYAVATSLILGVFFLVRILVLYCRSKRVFCWSVDDEYARELKCATTIRADMFNFSREFGEDPLVLGLEGTAKELVRISEGIIALNECDLQDHIIEEKKEILSRKVSRMRFAAKKLFPINSQEEIMETARRGESVPNWIPNPVVKQINLGDK